MNSSGSRRQILLGGGMALGIIVFLAITVAIQYVALQHPKRWDLTGTGQYTLAPQSKQVLGTFKEREIPIEIVAFYETKEGRARESVRDLLNQYKDAYSDFTYSFVDPDKERSVALRYKIESYPTILIKAGDKEERITTADEETVTNTLVKLLRTEAKKVYFTKGHGELSPGQTDPQGLSIAKDEVGKQNYKVEETVLMQTTSAPDDAAMLVIAGPKTDFIDEEIEQIKTYLNKGGKLLVLLNPFKSPKLTGMLKEYGFEFADDIVVDRMSKALGGDYLMPVITSYVQFPITKNFDVASFFPETRSVKVSKNTIPSVTAKELALTSPVSWTINEEQLKSGKADFDEKTGTRGPVPVMAVSTYMTTPPEKEAGAKEDASKEPESAEKASTGQKGDAAAPKAPLKARLVVFGSSLFASNKFFKLQGNGELFMNTVSWLAEEENLIAIRPKSSRGQPLVLTERQSLLTFLIPVVVVPLAWFVLGIGVYSYRRRTASG
jgi:ABC-type uncharacterized transport system involved in gliding motility auxiliary subunit